MLFAKLKMASPESSRFALQALRTIRGLNTYLYYFGGFLIVIIV